MRPMMSYLKSKPLTTQFLHVFLYKKFGYSILYLKSVEQFKTKRYSYRSSIHKNVSLSFVCNVEIPCIS